MSRNKSSWAFEALVILPALALVVAAQQSSSLSIAGQAGSAKVIQVDGRNYVEVEGFARLTNGSISFNGGGNVFNFSDAPSKPSFTRFPFSGVFQRFFTGGIDS